ncbi:MAG: transcription antitermination factor NusB [Clostridia bacterium]|nr:transcription antitermination factor NusB [Clostridia bacterium]
MTRREEREEAFLMLFEKEFAPEKSPEEIYGDAKDARDVEDSDYIRAVLAGVSEHRAELDELLDAHAHGWKRNRISGVARAAILLACYEMLYMADVPTRVSLNEAIELMKKYDEDKARVFVNGVLNAISRDERVLAKRNEQA